MAASEPAGGAAAIITLNVGGTIFQTRRSTLSPEGVPETFFSALQYVGKADCERCWKVFFASLERFDGSRNRSIRDNLWFFERYDQDEARRLLQAADFVFEP